MNLIIFSDIDGTFYPANFTEHEKTVADIKYAQSLGVHFVFCTGNPYFQYVKDLALKVNAEYMITSNGAAVIEVKTGKYIHKEMLSKGLTQKLLDKANQLGLASDWWDDNTLFFNSVVPQKYLDYWKTRSSFAIVVSDVAPKPCFKIEFQHTDPTLIDQMVEFMADLDVQAARITPGHVEVTYHHASKGTGIIWLANYLNIPLSETMGIGDSANDLSMFAVVGHAYAMANAPEHIKVHARHHTAAVEQNGLGLAIEDFLYRKGHRR